MSEEMKREVAKFENMKRLAIGKQEGHHKFKAKWVEEEKDE